MRQQGRSSHEEEMQESICSLLFLICRFTSNLLLLLLSKLMVNEQNILETLFGIAFASFVLVNG